MEVAVTEVKLLEGGDDLFALAPLGAKDGLDNGVGLDDVEGAVDFYFVGTNVKVFFFEEGLKAHGSVWWLPM